jgi:photosystem II stability/assembly factor-like uncharacterized protein
MVSQTATLEVGGEVTVTSTRRIFVGTESGVAIVAEHGGEWRMDQGPTGPRLTSLIALNQIGLVFGASPRDGVYASRDGRSWEKVFSADVQVLAADPSNASTVYAGTEPINLFRTQDAGDSWAELTGLQALPEEVKESWWFPVYPHEGHVKSIWVSPLDSRLIYLGLEHGGILRSFDAGETWEDISRGIEYLDIHMVQGDRSVGNVAYAATARAFYRSEDYGRDWLLCTDGLTRDYMHDFVTCSGEAPSLFMATANGTPPAWIRPSQAESAIFRSRDQGTTWRQLGGGLPSSLDRMVWGLVGDPLDTQILYAGMGQGPNNRGPERGGDVWVSPDQGGTWRQIYEGPGVVRALCVAVS